MLLFPEFLRRKPRGKNRYGHFFPQLGVSALTEENWKNITFQSKCFHMELPLKSFDFLNKYFLYSSRSLLQEEVQKIFKLLLGKKKLENSQQTVDQ